METVVKVDQLTKKFGSFIIKVAPAALIQPLPPLVLNKLELFIVIFPLFVTVYPPYILTVATRLQVTDAEIVLLL